jgi:hypothetical protein
MDDVSNSKFDGQVARYSIECRVSSTGINLSKEWFIFESNVQSYVLREDRSVHRRLSVDGCGTY